MAKIGDVCASKIDTLSAAYNGKIDYIDISAVDNREKKITQTAIVLAKDAPSRAKQLVEHGDVIVSLVRPNLNAVAIIEEQSQNLQVASTGYCVLRCNQMIYNRYLFYFCQSETFVNSMTAQATGASYPAVSNSIVKNCEIPLPERNKQKEIADILDKVTSLISLRKQQLVKLDELVKARFVEMFGNIIRNDKSWPIHNFSDIASSRLGKMLDAKQQTGKYSYPYLANFNVQWFNFNVDNLNQMDFNEAEQKEFELRDGDLLVCEGGEIGRCAVWHNEIQPCFFQKALHRVRCNRQLVQPDYLAWWFKYNCNHGGFAEIAGAKATIAHLPGIKLKQLQVALPPLSLQNEFAAFVERVDQQKQTVQQSLEKLELMKKALMQEYFG